MNVLIRTDASKQIGSGHVMRCLTLADGLRKAGAQIKFACSREEGHLCDLIMERGYEVVSAVENIGTADLLMVDHYDLDEQWEKSQRPFFKHIFVIDDLAREHDCDILLDQNLVSNFKTRYADKVPENCKLLLGPEYALLPPIYAELHHRIPPREGKVKRILVSFGGGDYEDLYAQVMADFLGLNRTDIKLDIVIPGQHSLKSRHDNIEIYAKLPNLAGLMAQADLAIGASGSTTWERLCLGLPSIILVLADNQIEIAQELNRRELAKWYESKDLRWVLKNTIESGLDGSWSKRCGNWVDGLGLNRVLAILTAHQNMPLKICHVSLEDEDWLLEVANDPVTRQNSFSIDKISPETHRKWFYEKLRDFENCCFYKAETGDGIVIGSVRFQLQKDGRWELNYSLLPNFRTLGLGKHFLEKAIEKLHSQRGDVTVYGHVKPENIASQKIFKSLGLLLT